MDVTTAAAIRPVIAVKPTSVSVNGISIPRDAIAREAQNHPAGSSRQAWEAAARALVIRELMLQRAKILKLEPTPMSDAEGRHETEEEALVRGVIEHDVMVPTADHASCRRFYDQNLRRFRTPDLFAVSHILIAAAPDDVAGRDVARSTAEGLLAELRAAPAAFEAIALSHSCCPSREVGGSLGQIGPGQTVPEFEKALPTIGVGSVGASPIESRYGFHIVRVERRDAGRQLTFEIVRERIAEYLDERVRRAAVRQYVTVLAGTADIIGIDLTASSTPLVQ
jgi:peptidyl-prolyl cis-trans isomerase C